MKRKHSLTLVLLPLLFLIVSWGVTGHKTIGVIAQNHLNAKTSSDIQHLLGNQTLADISTWADEVRNDAAYKHTSSWHFLNLPLGLSCKEFEAKVNNMGTDNVFGALQKCQRDLKDPSSTEEQKAEALKFIVHFVGDLHQPMHISRAEDKGGNTIQLNYEGKGTNLHSLWDTKLLESEGLSYQPLAEKLNHDITPKQIKEWQHDPMIKWMWESYQISSALYAEIDSMKGRSIGKEYYNKHIGEIEERISKAGVRLAGLLNELFKD